MFLTLPRRDPKKVVVSRVHIGDTTLVHPLVVNYYIQQQVKLASLRGNR